MRSTNFIRRWTSISAIVIALVGLVHNLATPMIHTQIYAQLPAADAIAGDLFFLATGTALIVLGVLTAMGARALSQGEPWARRLASSTGLYVALVGLGGVWIIPTNPFAYIAVVAGALLLVPVLLSRTAPRPLAGAAGGHHG